MNVPERHSFTELLEKRIDEEKISFFKLAPIKKAYYVGAYSRAVILSSFRSQVSKKNTTFKNWLSNQVINYRNLDKIYAKANMYEQKLKLKIRNDSEVRTLVHEVPPQSSAGLSSAKISFAFLAGFDDYKKFLEKYPSKIRE